MARANISHGSAGRKPDRSLEINLVLQSWHAYGTITDLAPDVF